MPTFDFTSPDGKSYSVDGPEGATPEQAFQILQQQLGATPKSEGSSIAGVAKSLGTGLVQGVAGLAGIPGDVSYLYAPQGSAPNPIGSEAILKKIESYTGGLYKPQGTAEDVASKIGQFAPAVIGGPETLAARVATRAVAPAVASEIGGKIAGPYGEVAGALAGAAGASAAVQKFRAMAAARQATNATPGTEKILETAGKQFDQARDMNVVVKPDFATNAADEMRQAIKGFDPEAHRPVFAAADRLENLAASGNPPEAIRSAAIRYNGKVYEGTQHFEAYNEVAKATGKKFDDVIGVNPEDHGFVTTRGRFVSPEEAAKVANAAEQTRAWASDTPKLSSESLIKDYQNGLSWKPSASSPVAMNDVENIRKQLVSLKTSPDASVREAARQAIRSLQKSQMALTPAETLAGDAGAFSSLTKDAVANWAAGKRSNIVMGKAALGELNAATAGSGANEDNALRQAFKQLARPVNNDITPKWQRLGFNKEEGAAIEQAARGTTTGNIARYLGKGAPTGIVSAAGGLGIGHMAGGPIGAVALPAAGYIAKKIGDLSTKRAVSAVDSLVRSRSPLAAQVAAQLPPQIVQQLPAKSQRLLQALILADPILSKQIGQPVGQPAAQ